MIRDELSYIFVVFVIFHLDSSASLFSFPHFIATFALPNKNNRLSER